MENSSRSSLPQFSLGSSLWFSELSSQWIMAGSMAKSIRMVRMSERQLRRKVSICSTEDGPCSLLPTDVANIWCQNRASFSCNGLLVLIMR